MAAARLADVGAGDAQPLVLGGRGEHPLQQLAVGGLDLGALGERLACRGDPRHQRVADPLQLAEADDARLARRRRHAGLDREARERLGREPRQLPLQAADLAPQIGSRQALVALRGLNPGERVDQLWHNPFECRSTCGRRKRGLR